MPFRMHVSRQETCITPAKKSTHSEHGLYARNLILIKQLDSVYISLRCSIGNDCKVRWCFHLPVLLVLAAIDFDSNIVGLAAG